MYSIRHGATSEFWQLAVPVAVLVVSVWQYGGGRRALWTIGGGVAVAVAVIAPFLATGLAIPLFLETVLAPVYGVEGYTIAGRLLGVVVEFGYGTLLIPIAAVGWGLAARHDASQYWWIGTGGMLYLCQLFLEMQGAIELVLLVVFLAVGVGVVVATLTRPSRRRVMAMAVVVVMVLNVYWLAGQITPIKTVVENERAEQTIPDYETLPEEPAGIPLMQIIYWEQHRPDTCHYRLGHKQRWYAYTTGGSVMKQECGQWPFDDSPRQWAINRLTPG